MDIKGHDSGERHPSKVLTLTLAGEYFGLDIYSVREILDMTEITRIPQMPSYMLGVVNVRGSAVPVVDLRQRFGMEKGEITINSRIVILEIKRGDEVGVIGALADSVKEVLELERDRIDPPPKMGGSVKADLLRGIGKFNGKFLLLLDLDKVFSQDELESLTEARPEMERVELDLHDATATA